MVVQDNEIDAVITWVDGNDPVLRKKRIKVEGELTKVKNELLTGRDQTRFIDNGELEYCIYSIRKFAPWIRKIFLVTDDQRPEYLTQDLIEAFNVEIIDHEEIFRSYEWALPTFNTRSIESMLWRIEGLAEKFIYFNDDFILTHPVEKDDFFSNERVVLRGRWNLIRNFGPLRMKINAVLNNIARKVLGITRSMHLLQQIKSAQLAGFEKKYFRSPHVPHPVRRTALSSFFDENPDVLSANIQYKFRSTDQFSAIFLANHLEIANNSAILRNANELVMINGEVDFGVTFRLKMNRLLKKKAKFLCLQAAENLSHNQQELLYQTLRDCLNMPYRITKSNAHMNHLEEN